MKAPDASVVPAFTRPVPVFVSSTVAPAIALALESSTEPEIWPVNPWPFKAETPRAAANVRYTKQRDVTMGPLFNAATLPQMELACKDRMGTYSTGNVLNCIPHAEPEAGRWSMRKPTTPSVLRCETQGRKRGRFHWRMFGGC